MRAHGEVTEALAVGPWPSVVVALVLLAGLLVRTGGPERVRTAGSVLTGRRTAWAALAVGIGLAVVARTGAPDELDNPVPPLVVGLGWPLLLVLPALARPPRADAEDAPGHVLPAVAAAAAVAGYLALWPDRARPAVLAAALASYVVVMVAVAVALGRPAAGRTEVLGLLARWVSLGRRLPAWAPPRGAAAVLALVLAGAWVERLRRSTEAPELAVVVAGSLALAAVVAAVAARYDAVPALVPVAAGAVVAGGLRRAMISAQLLADRGLTPDPLGVAGGQVAALVVVGLTGCLGGAVVARRTAAGLGRLPALAAMASATGASALVVLSH